jgi:putative methionine-R-sulfoxide reductase with GAF domain
VDDVTDAPREEAVAPHLRAIGDRGYGMATDPLGDMSLGHSDLQELLHGVLERIKRVLRADTAAVLLLDASGAELVARAAIGIEEEVRQGVRVPVGEGFAGRVVAEARPLVLDLVDDSTVSNPILWDKGIRSMLGVPLVAGDQVIGVLHVGSLRERRFDERDATILGLIGDRVGAAVQVRLLDADRDAAEAIQRSLLPSAPSSIAEFECAARYVPAERGGIGGDWYDVFQLETGEVWVIVGDVAGHGLRSAIIMGRVRSAMRAYALLGRGPDEVFALTDRKMAHFEVGNMATAAIAVIHPPYDEAQVALAGHPPFVLAPPDGPADLVEVPPGPPLGLWLERPAPTTVRIPRGAVLLGYTDGLIERRGESIEVGFDRLRQVVRADRPSLVCGRVMGSVMQGHVPEDDIAVIALRRRATAPPS